MLNLNTVMIGSNDPKVLRDFYVQVLGEPQFEDEAYSGWQAGASWLMIGAHSEVKGTNESPGRIMTNFETTDVKGEFARIKGLGATVVAEPYSPGDGMTIATFADPDGNYFQIASPMPEQP
jgi:predicted enzyme related to lactoylglutathione lyase